MEVLHSMAKGLILTVGEQIENIIFSIDKLKPEYLVLIGTNTSQCKKSINEISKKINVPQSNLKVLDELEDNPTSIDQVIQLFLDGYIWLTKNNNLKSSEIVVDPTGGRKWMSAGVTMVASLLGLKLVYVHVEYKSGRPDPSTMKIFDIGNAYEKTGLVELNVADELFNSGNFSAAISVYESLEKKLSNALKIKEVEIKKKIASGYLYLKQFKFLEAYKELSEVKDKINQIKDIFIGFRDKLIECLKNQIAILEILKKNDEINPETKQRVYSYFELLKDNDFSKNAIIFLFMLQQHYADNHQFETATIILYRILEFISQYRLAQNDINTDNINEEIRKNYNEDFKKISKEIYGAEREIPDKVALLDGWILLYCIKDELLKDQKNINFLKAIKGKTKPRNVLWIEHGNEGVDETQYNEFKNFVCQWICKIISNIEDYKNIEFVKFQLQHGFTIHN